MHRFVSRILDIQRIVGLVSVSLGFPWMTRGEPVDNVVERREVPEPGPRIYLRGQIVEYLGDLLAGVDEAVRSGNLLAGLAGRLRLIDSEGRALNR